MGTLMDDEIKRWTARRKSALVLEIIQGKTTVAEASRLHDLPPSELEKWIEDGKRGMENALRANPQDVREQYEKQLKDLQEAYGKPCWSCVFEKNCSPCWARTRNDRRDPPGTER
jgi:transposase-like protein